MTNYRKFLANTSVRRGTVLASLALVLFLARSMMSTILLTFILTFLVTKLIISIRRRVKIKPIFIVAPLYLLIVGGLIYATVHYAPVIVNQSLKLFNSIVDFYNSEAASHSHLMRLIVEGAQEMNLEKQMEMGLSTVLGYLTNIGSMGLTLLISLVLSFFFGAELDELKRFGNKLIDSPFGWYFADVKFFADKFINTFGVVIEAQLFIAVVNTIITTITLAVMHMPYLPSLAVMVFLLSLIPVAGVVISVIPLAAIAYTVDGLQGIITIIVMIVVIHMLETYVLNPKFLSSRTKLPIFFTFVVLVIGERLWGIWGLIIGLPTFTFLLDIIGVDRGEKRSGMAEPTDVTADQKNAEQPDEKE